MGTVEAESPITKLTLVCVSNVIVQSFFFFLGGGGSDFSISNNNNNKRSYKIQHPPPLLLGVGDFITEALSRAVAISTNGFSMFLPVLVSAWINGTVY